MHFNDNNPAGFITGGSNKPNHNKTRKVTKMTNKTVNEIMKSIEERLLIVVNKLQEMKQDAIAFEMQNIWDEVNFIRDDNPQFIFKDWREGNAEQKIQQQNERAEVGMLCIEKCRDLIVHDLEAAGYEELGYAVARMFVDVNLHRDEYKNFNYSAYEEKQFNERISKKNS